MHDGGGEGDKSKSVRAEHSPLKYFGKRNCSVWPIISNISLATCTIMWGRHCMSFKPIMLPCEKCLSWDGPAAAHASTRKHWCCQWCAKSNRESILSRFESHRRFDSNIRLHDLMCVIRRRFCFAFSANLLGIIFIIFILLILELIVCKSFLVLFV